MDVVREDMQIVGVREEDAEGREQQRTMMENLGKAEREKKMSAMFEIDVLKPNQTD